MNCKPHEPYEWYLESGKYAIKNKHCMDYGALFLLQPEAPPEAIEAYKKYINLCKKPFMNRNLCLYKNNRVVSFLPTNDPLEQEQIEIFKQLIKDGYINNDPFILDTEPL